MVFKLFKQNVNSFCCSTEQGGTKTDQNAVTGMLPSPVKSGARQRGG